ncbi:MAG: tRNA (adenosine(37)-N6)-threonylcarbamoyltransferase complex dimerization subunit type 1 TsaB [Anaerotruncus sp.]|nr:MAG: tRNA (adenosine(37)-N6)-threonylcarbamoyltransferase complex dimerization subunit type 1 TsaB [Anaerotruncus sp.]
MLSVDSSAVTASAALTENGNIIKSEFLNAGLTHSETLMPMIDKVMQGFDYSKLDAIAISAGPGSFTGVRIGVATVKGLAFVNNTPCIPVSTLEAAAYNFANENAVICAVMDARRMQFYNALFKAENGKIIRLCEDRAIGLKRAFCLRFQSMTGLSPLAPVLSFFAIMRGLIILNVRREMLFLSICRRRCCGRTKIKKKINPAALMPVYLRLSQAERELKLKISCCF